MLPELESPADHSLARQLSDAFRVVGALVAGAFVLVAVAYGVRHTWLTPDYEYSRRALTAQRVAFAAITDEQRVSARLSSHSSDHAGHFALATEGPRKGTAVSATPALDEAMVMARVAEQSWREQRAQAARSPLHEGAAQAALVEARFERYRRAQDQLAAALDLRSEALYQREQGVVALQRWLVLLVFFALFALALHQHHALHNSIVVPVAALLRHIGRVRDGQLEATIDPAGPKELRQLGEGLNDMVRALTAAREVAQSRDEALRDHSARLRQILEASREFSESLNLSYVVGAVRESTANLGGYDRVIVWLMDDEQKRLVDSDESLGGVMAAAHPSGVQLGRGLAGRAAKSGRITFECSSGKVQFTDESMGPVRAIAIPLIVGARVVGALEGRNTAAALASKDKIEVLEMLATHAATAIESARLHEVIEQRSQVDPLTRLCNRRRLDEDLEAECRRSVRYSRPLAFVMLDVDHFKAFNDAHGHPQADVALQQVATVLAGCLRTTDTAYRYGGEEFCVILRETSGVDAMQFAERARKRIEQHFASGPTAGITASFGVANFCAETPAPRALVQAADAAMYESKHGGRNRVSLSTLPPVVSATVHA